MWEQVVKLRRWQRRLATPQPCNRGDFGVFCFVWEAGYVDQIRNSITPSLKNHAPQQKSHPERLEVLDHRAGGIERIGTHVKRVLDLDHLAMLQGLRFRESHNLFQSLIAVLITVLFRVLINITIGPGERLQFIERKFTVA